MPKSTKLDIEAPPPPQAGQQDWPWGPPVDPPPAAPPPSQWPPITPPGTPDPGPEPPAAEVGPDFRVPRPLEQQTPHPYRMNEQAAPDVPPQLTQAQLDATGLPDNDAEVGDGPDFRPRRKLAEQSGPYRMGESGPHDPKEVDVFAHLKPVEPEDKEK